LQNIVKKRRGNKELAKSPASLRGFYWSIAHEGQL